MTSALEMKNVWLTFAAADGSLDVLKDISIDIQSGSSVAIVGPSGSGKSSLISVAAGLEKPSRGEVSLLGERIEALSEDRLARLRRGRVSMVFQSFHLLETMTAFDNVRTPLEIAGLDCVEARADEWLERVGLSHRRLHYPGQLSGGERQRVAVARALASDPAVIFADEPTGNLDAESGRGVADLLFALTGDRETTLVLVTHDTEFASRAARVVHMRDGRIE
ncbi:ABC transporter ATP-binding protein [Hyphomonas oceanitis]|uniref:ABC transporter-like protein n=1 Tax=Hyphomonas oceanitis SCH89 TaxID=1280953 RepID=A0A059G4M2_9PROT|nr:ABC transporter ATP-binding protein [Hyphomonas oceanitis]KDA01393.1 ABC transporter-like protein [Hyphomonas oceanitis SCH89]